MGVASLASKIDPFQVAFSVGKQNGQKENQTAAQRVGRLGFGVQKFPKVKQTITHRIHGTGISTYIYHTNQPNVGKYTIHGSYGHYDIVTIEASLVVCWDPYSSLLSFIYLA